MIHIILASVVVLLEIVCSMAQAAQPSARITAFRSWSGPDHTRLVVDMQQEAVYTSFSLQQPRRLVIDVQNTDLDIQKRTISIEDRIIKAVRFGMFRPGVVRMVVDVKTSTQHEIFTLKPSYGNPHRLVVDLTSPELAHQEATKRKSFLEKEQPHARVVVIDPGHGGEDPGASGAMGAREKDIVLSIARRLRDTMDRQRGLRVFLTRESDYYIPLRKRYEIAQELGAHLFISLHCDAHSNHNAQGASVYALSYSGATDEAARLLANKENASDEVAGMLQSSHSVNTILLDMVQTHNLNQSLEFGEIVLRRLRSVIGLKFSEPRQAGFMVLKAPEIPSVLVEIGYISAPQEERLLRTNQFQSRLCSALAGAIDEFFAVKRVPSSQKRASHFSPAAIR